jgi:hypothetical protein
MTDNNRQLNTNQRDPEDNALDRELNAALAKFTAVEPRAGLEERVLANLRAEQEHAAEHSWWRWPAIAVLTAAIVVTVFATWRSRKPAQNIAEQHPAATTPANGHAGTRVANNGGGGSTRPRETAPTRKLKPHAVSHSVAMGPSKPMLDKFPSPQPLSVQETILTRYVANYPDHAALIAQARTEELRRDSAEETGEAASANGQNSRQQNK